MLCPFCDYGGHDNIVSLPRQERLPALHMLTTQCCQRLVKCVWYGVSLLV